MQGNDANWAETVGILHGVPKLDQPGRAVVANIHQVQVGPGMAAISDRRSGIGLAGDAPARTPGIPRVNEFDTALPRSG